MHQKLPISKSELLSLPDVYFLLNHELPYDSIEVIEFLEDKGIAWLKEQRILLHYLQTDEDYKIALEEASEGNGHEEVLEFLIKNRHLLYRDNEFKEFFRKSGHDRSVSIEDVYVELLKFNPTFIVDLAKARKNYAPQIQEILQGDDQRFLFGIFEKYADNRDADTKRAAFQNLLMVQQFSTPFCRVLRSTTGEFSSQDVSALSLSEIAYILKYSPNQSFFKASNLLLAIAKDPKRQESLVQITDTAVIPDLEPDLEAAVEYFANSFIGIESQEILDIFNIFFSNSDEMRVAAVRALIQTENIVLSRLNSNSKLAEVLSKLASEETVASFSDSEKLGIINLASSSNKCTRPLVTLFNLALKDKDYLMLSIILNASGIRLYVGFDDEHKDLPKELTVLTNFKELCQVIVHADSVTFLNPLIKFIKEATSPEFYFSALWAICKYAEECHSYVILHRLEQILTPIVETEFIAKNRQEAFVELVRLSNINSLKTVIGSSKSILAPEAKRLLGNNEYFYRSCADAASSEEPFAELLDILRAMHAGGKLKTPKMSKIFTGRLYEVTLNFHKLLLTHDLYDRGSTSFGACNSETGKFTEYQMSSYDGLKPVQNLKKLKVSVVPDIGMPHYQIIFRFLISANSDLANSLALKLIRALKATSLGADENMSIEANFYWLAISKGKYSLANLIKTNFSVSIANSVKQVTPKSETDKIRQLIRLCLKSRFFLNPEHSENNPLTATFLYAGYLVLQRERELNVCGNLYSNFIGEVATIFEEGEKSFSVLSSNTKVDWKKFMKLLLAEEEMSDQSKELFEIFMEAVSLTKNKKGIFKSYLESLGNNLEPSFSNLSRLVLMANSEFRKEFLTVAKTALCSKANFYSTQTNKFSFILGEFLPTEIVTRILVMTFSRSSVGELGDFVARNLSFLSREQLKPVIENTLEDDTQSFMSL